MFGKASTGEKKMKRAILAFGAVLAMGAASVNADIVNPDWSFVTTTVTPASGGNSGLDIVRFFAKLNPTGQDAGATGAQSIDAILTASAPFKFKTNGDINLDSFNDADVTGATTLSDAVQRGNNASTAIRLDPSGGPNGFFTVTVEPNTSSVLVPPHGGNVSQTDVDGNLTYDPIADGGWGSTIKQFRVVGILNGGADKKAVSDPNGALIATAVVPHGTTVALTGTLASDTGPISIIGVPEPTALGFIGLGGLLLGRRRRTA